MAVHTRNNEGKYLKIVDGEIDRPRRVTLLEARACTSQELALAKAVYNMTHGRMGAHAIDQQWGGNYCSDVRVYVLGFEQWLRGASLPDSLRRVTDGASSDGYRLLIHQYTVHRSPDGNEEAKLALDRTLTNAPEIAGLRIRRPPRASWEADAEAFLELMIDREPASVEDYLQQHEVPFAYRRDLRY